MDFLKMNCNGLIILTMILQSSSNFQDQFPQYQIAKIELFRMHSAIQPTMLASTHTKVEPTRTSTVEAKAALEHAADDMKQYYDCSCQSVPEYKVGDKVWLSLQYYS